jgi:hypothetical protein
MSGTLVPKCPNSSRAGVVIRTALAHADGQTASFAVARFEMARFEMASGQNKRPQREAEAEVAGRRRGRLRNPPIGHYLLDFKSGLIWKVERRTETGHTRRNVSWRRSRSSRRSTKSLIEFGTSRSLRSHAAAVRPVSHR